MSSVASAPVPRTEVVAVLGAGRSAVGAILDLAQLRDRRQTGNGDCLDAPWRHPREVALRRQREFSLYVRRYQTETGLDANASALHEPGEHLAKLSARGELVTGAATEGFPGAGVCDSVITTNSRVRGPAMKELKIRKDRTSLIEAEKLSEQAEPPRSCARMLTHSGAADRPRLHSCGTVRPHGARELAQPEPGFYFAGMKSYGRAPTFLMVTGYEQVRSIMAEIAGDREAAGRVELVLPETGVCSGPVAASSASEGCCGGPAPVGVDACCQQDAIAKEAGARGCGCS